MIQYPDCKWLAKSKQSDAKSGVETYALGSCNLIVACHGLVGHLFALQQQIMYIKKLWMCVISMYIRGHKLTNTITRNKWNFVYYRQFVITWTNITRYMIIEIMQCATFVRSSAFMLLPMRVKPFLVVTGGKCYNFIVSMLKICEQKTNKIT